MMAALTFDIPYPTTKAEMAVWNSSYGMNAYYAGKHWARRKEDAEFWHWLTAASLKKVCQAPKMFEKPVVMVFRFNDGMDCSNHCAEIKMIEDALKGFVIRDDSKNYVRGIYIGFHDLPVIRVTVMEEKEYEDKFK